jgi:hypothetical protein
MEQTCLTFANHFDIHILRILNDFNNIPICLCIVHNESFEVWFTIILFDHCVVELCPHDLLCFNVFKLHVANCNGHDFVICYIIYMANHCCLANDAFDMIKYDPKSLQIFPKLHLCIHVHSIPNPIKQHLQNEYFLI